MTEPRFGNHIRPGPPAPPRPPRPHKRRQGTGPALGFMLVTWPFSLLLGGFTLAQLWGWFVSDTFNVMRLSIGQAIGIDLLLTFLIYPAAGSSNPDRTPLEHTINRVIGAATLNVLLLGLGLIVHQFT